jgi:hypothetical protein
MPDARKEANRSGRQLTEKELAARRANARKSTGPRTAEGKARSSQNARRHGLFAQTALLDSESPEDFVALRDAYLAEFDPQGPAETHLVMEMANAQWRLRRVRGIEADLIDHIIGAELDSWRFPAGRRQAEAVRRLADSSHVLALLVRYETMFRRQYERALRLFWEHRDRLQPPEAPGARRQRPVRASAAPARAPWNLPAMDLPLDPAPDSSLPAIQEPVPPAVQPNRSPATLPPASEAVLAAPAQPGILQNEPEPLPAALTRPAVPGSQASGEPARTVAQASPDPAFLNSGQPPGRPAPGRPLLSARQTGAADPSNLRHSLALGRPSAGRLAADRRSRAGK